MNYGSVAGTPGCGTIDSRSASAASFYAHRFSNRHWIGATYNFQQLMFDPGGRTTIHRALAFYSLILGAHMTLSLWAGPQYSTTFISNVLVAPAGAGGALTLPSQWSPTGGVMFGWGGARTSLQAGYSRMISDGSGVAAAVTSQQANAEFRRRVAARWTATAGLAYARNNPLNIVSATTPLRSFRERRNQLSHHRQSGSQHVLRTAAAAIRIPPAEALPQAKIACGFLSLSLCPPIGKVIMPEVLDDPSLEKTNWNKQWRVLCRRRWWLALPAFLIFALVWTVAWMLPAVYRSETLILVEQQKVPEQYVVSNVAADLQERLQSMTQQIVSRTRLLHIVDQLNLYPKQRGHLSTDELVEMMRKDIQIELVQSPSKRELTAFKIAYLAANPTVAQQVTNQLSSLFIEENLKVRQQQAENTTDFLDSQLNDARQGLSAQEQRVKDFKIQHLGELPTQVESNVQILSGLQMRVQQETEALAHAKQQSVYLESLLSQYRSTRSEIRSRQSNLFANASGIGSGIGPSPCSTGRPQRTLHRPSS